MSYAFLHTWGQNLLDHPHLHCIIPAGGLRTKDNRWKHCKNNFFAPVAVMQQVYRGKFMDYFKYAIRLKEIQFHGVLQQYEDPRKLATYFDALY